MPVSKKRTKRPKQLAGVPGRVMAMSPRDWTPERRAEWCRHYLDGAAGRQISMPRGHRGSVPAWIRMVHRKGAEDAAVARSDVAQSDSHRAASEARRKARSSSTTDGLRHRLDAFNDLGLVDPSIIGRMIGTLGAGLELISAPHRTKTRD